MSPLSRRGLLGVAAGVAGVGLASALLPPSIRKALLAGPPGRGTLGDVRHVVCVM
jgi:phospholipase C